MHFYIRRNPRDEGLGREVPDVPGKLLDRHGARVTRPAASAYRADVLRVPQTVDRAAVERTLAGINLKLADPVHDAGARHRSTVVRLEARDPGKPANVDAWHALSHLRQAADDEPDGELAGVFKTPDRVALERLLFVALDPAPWDTHDLDPAPWDTHGGSYLRSKRGGPVPVCMTVHPTNPRPVVPGSGFDRRPVVAVLDTGISAHEWFGTTGPGSGVPPGGFIRVLEDVQEAITESSKESGNPARVIEDYWDSEVPDNPLTGMLDPHAGHGTFIAGIIRQVAPDSEVAVARVMAGDGVAYESDVLAGLERLVERVRAAQAPGGDPADMVDILSLSIGYYCETLEDEAETTEFAALLNTLSDLGVLVVAAAGNDATARPFFPAALAATHGGGGQPVLSVGALNPNGTKAFFSNQAPWVHAWATGAGLVSTFPMLRGSAGPVRAIRELDRESLDPDDYSGGFAMWHGTSFAGPHAASVLANRLIDQADADPAQVRMGLVSREAMRERARRAVRTCTTD
jgi:Subtilase family